MRVACLSSRLGGALVAALLAVAAPQAGAQQGGEGIVTGRVSEQGSNAPVPEAQVFIVGTNLGGRSNAEGEFTIRNVPAGAQRIRALRIGYTEVTQPVTITPGTPVTSNFTLTRSAIQLQEIVTTATGEQRRVELGNTVSNISVAEVTQTAPVTSISDVLNARSPGVVVTAGSATGTGSRIRIRGASSLNLANEPIYIIDGIRMTSTPASIGISTGGPEPSRVGDLNPEEIENIEIVKGPSAATLYGTDAANGVIVITTKRGRSGPARWSAWAEGGIIEDRVNNYPTNYTINGQLPSDTAGAAPRVCTLPQVSSGACLLDSVRVLNVFNDDEITPVGQGNRYQAGLQVSGGTDQVRYFISGEREEETGVMELPQFERARLNEEGVTIDPWVARPNVLDKKSVRVNVSAAITPKLDVDVSTGYVNLQQRFSQDNNATAGLGSHLFGGPGHKENGSVSGLGTPRMGYRDWTPAYTFAERNAQRVNRFIGSVNANYRPLSWLTTNAVFGLDFTGRVDDRFRRRGEGPPLNAEYRLGFKQNVRANLRNLTANISGAATWQPLDWVNSRTTVGVQYINYQLDQSSASGTDLPPGTQTAGAGAEPGSSESTVLNKTLGAFIEEQVAINDRLFLTAALRTDQNSAFGTDFQSVVYPKASISWIVSEEEFFPTAGWLDQFRFRAAYGASGVQPGPNDALRTFAATTTNINGVDQPGVIFAEVGNADLRPEKTTELETGFDMRLFQSRASLELTYYHKRTQDAIINAIVAPSLGAATNVATNLGSVRNYGYEALLTTQLVDRPSFGIDVAVNASWNDNKLVSLGETPAQIGVTSRTVEGFPLFSFWSRKISGWDDKNGDGILTYSADEALNEVFVDDSASFIGEANAKRNVSVTGGIELLDRRLRLSALVDHRGGFHWYNNTERIRCASRQNCNGLMNPDASFEEQAMVVASLNHPARTLAGFIQQGDFIRIREISATYSIPESLLGRLGGMSSLALNFAARNVALWTDYRGIDPESFRDAGGSVNTGDDFQGLGPPSYFTFRVNVGF